VKFTVKSHSVDATQITSIGPLYSEGKMMGPNDGLQVALKNGRTHKWVSEKDGYVPAIGDYFIVDADLKVSFILPASKFKELFAEAEEV